MSIENILTQAKSSSVNQFLQAHKNAIESFDGNLDVCSLTLIVERNYIFIEFVDEKYFNHSVKGI
jgi:hypothetical protein